MTESIEDDPFVIEIFATTTEGNIPRFKELVKECGPQIVQHQNARGQTPLHIALENNDVAFAEYLLSDDFIDRVESEPFLRMDIVDNLGYTPLQYCYPQGTCSPERQREFLPLLRKVLRHPSSIAHDVINMGRDDTSKHGGTYLISQSAFGNACVVEELLSDEYKCDPNIPAKYGFTALMTACGCGWNGVVSALLRSGRCDLEATLNNIPGLTALTTAVAMDYPTIVSELVEAGANKEIKFLLMYNLETVAKMLQSWDALYYFRGYDFVKAGKQWTEFNVPRRDSECKPQLRQSDLQTESNLNDARQAIIEGNIAFFCECAPNPEWIDEVDSDGESLLHLAAEMTDFRCIQKLLDLGADVNQVDQDSNTAGHFVFLHEARDAIERDNKFHIIQFLIGRGANIRLKNSEGHDVYDLACRAASADGVSSKDCERFKGFLRRPKGWRTPKRGGGFSSNDIPFAASNKNLGKTWSALSNPRDKLPRVRILDEKYKEFFGVDFGSILEEMSYGYVPSDPDLQTDLIIYRLQQVRPWCETCDGEERRESASYCDKCRQSYCFKQAMRLQQNRNGDFEANMRRYGCGFKPGNDAHIISLHNGLKFHHRRHMVLNLDNLCPMASKELAKNILAPSGTWYRTIIRQWTSETEQMFSKVVGAFARRDFIDPFTMFGCYLDEAMSFLEASEKDDVTAYRGRVYRYLNLTEDDIALMLSQVGEEVSFGFLATSSDGSRCESLGCCLYVIDIPQDPDIAIRPGYDISKLSNHPGEKEVLLPPGQVYLINSASWIESGETKRWEFYMTMSTFGNFVPNKRS